MNHFPNKIIAIIVIFSVLLSSSSISVQQNNDSLDSLHGVSNETYKKIMDYFSSAYGENTFPEYYGGSIIGRNGNLVVQLTQDTEEVRSLLKKQSDDFSISFVSVKNTYGTIVNEYNYWKDILLNNRVEDENLRNALDYLTEVYIDENANGIVFGLTKIDTGIQSAILNNAINPEIIQFTESGPGVPYVSVNPGGRITINDGYYSMGFRCYFYEDGSNIPTYGIVSAAHQTALYEDCRKGDQYGTKIGYVARRQFSGNVDATAIALYPAHSGTLTTNYGNRSINGTTYTTAIATNSTIYCEGGTSGLLQGLVASSSAMFYYDGVWVSDLIKSTYVSDNGDSGGIVYVPYGSGYILAGINVAGGIFYNYACQAQYIISALGVSIY